VGNLYCINFPYVVPFYYCILAEYHLRVNIMVATVWWADGWLRDTVVGCTLGYWEQLNPSVMLIVDKCPEMRFHYNIDPFCLSIGLWVKDCEEFSFICICVSRIFLHIVVVCLTQ
jgi:hypothetical protein